MGEKWVVCHPLKIMFKRLDWQCAFSVVIQSFSGDRSIDQYLVLNHLFWEKWWHIVPLICIPFCILLSCHWVCTCGKCNGQTIILWHLERSPFFSKLLYLIRYTGGIKILIPHSYDMDCNRTEDGSLWIPVHNDCKLISIINPCCHFKGYIPCRYSCPNSVTTVLQWC